MLAVGRRRRADGSRHGGGGAAARFRFVPGDRLRRLPRGRARTSRASPRKGETTYGEVQGLIDGHMHWMTFEYFGGNFHCGRPWDPYGIP